jgi:carbamate kinase
MLVVAALGGNALLRRGERLDADVQRHNAKLAAESLALLVPPNRLIVTHGNGPQVGMLAIQSEASTVSRPYPLDVLDAETEGMIGYLLEQELGFHLPTEQLATLLTQVVVDPDDPGFEHPTKPVGPMLDEHAARLATAQRGWSIAVDGRGWRRVVASPEPRRILELQTIRLLVDADVTVICAGGGGIPVVPDPDGGYRGVEAVVDKDLAASLLAREVGADALLLLTDVDAVYRDFDTPAAAPIRRATPAQLRSTGFAAGSMGPKVEAACRFVEAGGWFAAIGALTDAAGLLAGTAGTLVTTT